MVALSSTHQHVVIILCRSVMSIFKNPIQIIQSKKEINKSFNYPAWIDCIILTQFDCGNLLIHIFKQQLTSGCCNVKYQNKSSGRLSGSKSGNLKDITPEYDSWRLVSSSCSPSPEPEAKSRRSFWIQNTANRRLPFDTLREFVAFKSPLMMSFKSSPLMLTDQADWKQKHMYKYNYEAGECLYYPSWSADQCLNYWNISRTHFPVNNWNHQD